MALDGRAPDYISMVSRGLRKTAVLVTLARDSRGELAVLFEKRAATLRRQPGEISFPGGHAEQGETMQRTAWREASEELGVAETDIQYVGALDVLIGWAGVIIHPFVGILREGMALEPNPDEVAEVFSVPLAKLVSMKPRKHAITSQLHPDEGFPFDLIPGGREYPWQSVVIEEEFYDVGSHVIWGMTARILSNFLLYVRSS